MGQHSITCCIKNVIRFSRSGRALAGETRAPTTGADVAAGAAAQCSQSTKGLSYDRISLQNREALQQCVGVGGEAGMWCESKGVGSANRVKWLPDNHRDKSARPNHHNFCQSPTHKQVTSSLCTKYGQSCHGPTGRWGGGGLRLWVAKCGDHTLSSQDCKPQLSGTPPPAPHTHTDGQGPSQVIVLHSCHVARPTQARRAAYQGVQARVRPALPP